MAVSKADPVLFVHGAWHGGWCWEKFFVPIFRARGYKTHVFDLPLHDLPGDRAGINSMGIGDYVDALKAEVDKLSRPPIIIGHSMGGYILQKYLTKENCAKAVLMASVPVSGVIGATTRLARRKLYVSQALVTGDLWQLVKNPKRAKWAFYSDSISNSRLNEFSRQLCSESFKAFLSMTGPNIGLSTPTKVPMLVIGAEDDRIFTRNENDNTARFYGADFQMVSDCAHDMMLEANHRIVADKILDWLEAGSISADATPVKL